jgi:hypothetical protein
LYEKNELRPAKERSMKRLFAVLVFLVIGVAVLGFYRGWFTVDFAKTQEGKGQVTGTVDAEKIEEDKKRAADKLNDLRRPSEIGATDKNQSKQP